MTRSVLFVVLCLAAVGLVQGEPSQEQPASYIRKGTWAETMLANSGDTILADLKRDFPVQALSFHNIFGWTVKGWPTRADLLKFEAVLRSDILEPGAARFKAELKELDSFSRLDQDRRLTAVLNLFEKILISERARLIKGLPPIAFVLRDGFGIHGTNATMFSHRTRWGSAICILDPASGEVRKIYETKTGFILDIRPSYDGKKLVMSHKLTNDDPFHIWEINIDGTGLMQITSGPFHDFNPVYYPDGRIAFSSSRVESYSLCQDFIASALYVVNTDGTNMRRIDFTTLSSVSPSIMPDGSIICSRWEYQDKNIFSWQGLWTVNPNGRQLKLYYGNTITVPNSLYGPQPIPGTDKVMITMAAHHHVPVGDIAIVDRSKGIENPDGMKQITHATTYSVAAGRKWDDNNNWRPGDAFFPQAFADPHPIDSETSIVSLGDNGLNRHHLYILGHNSLVLPLFADEKLSSFSAVSLAPRTAPNPIAGEVPVEAGTGTFFVQNIYEGLAEQGVTNGTVKAMRVIRPLPKKWNTEGPRFHDHYPVAGYGSYYIKENLGTVPVGEDGTVYFEAPSNCELYFIALDADGKEVQRMGSVTQITTGERVSCIGCHEDRDKAPAVNPGAFKRLNRPPDKLKPPPGGAGPFDYVKHVQPVFDRYCISCHSGRKPDGRVDLTGDKTRFFNMSFDHLIHRRAVAYYYINAGPTGVFPAMKTGSMISRLTKLIEEKHGEVDMDDESRRAVYRWIDSNVQYYNTWDMSRPHATGGRDTWLEVVTEENKRSVRPQSWVADLAAAYDANCKSCHGELHNKPGSWAGRSEKNHWVNLTNPENSSMLNAHLAAKAGGMGLEGKKDGAVAPQFADTADPVYRAMLEAIERGRDALLAKPRMDMPGGRAVPQKRDFGRVF